jgi:hypothetical protein
MDRQRLEGLHPDFAPILRYAKEPLVYQLSTLLILHPDKNWPFEQLSFCNIAWPAVLAHLDKSNELLTYDQMLKLEELTGQHLHAAYSANKNLTVAIMRRSCGWDYAVFLSADHTTLEMARECVTWCGGTMAM